MNPAIEVWIASAGDTCSSKTSRASSVGTGSGNIFTGINVPAGTSQEVWVRIASGNPSDFTLIINAICNNQ